MPKDNEITVKKLKAGTFVEDEASNTFGVNITWGPPPFQYRTALYYSLTYNLSGYTRDQFPCPGILKKGSGCTIIGIVSIILL